MAEFLNFFKIYLREFRKHFWQYLIIFLGMNLLLLLVFIPLFDTLASLIMQLGGIPYISYNNLGVIATQHLAGAIGLLLLLLVLLVIVYLQFSIQFVGVRLIQTDNFNLRTTLREAAGQVRQMNGRLLLFFLFYFLLILPFGKYVFSTPLLGKIQIPDFTMEFFLAKWTNMLILGLFYLLVFIIGNRFILVLPALILEKMRLREAVQQSLNKTRGLKNLLNFFVHFAVIGLSPWLVTQAISYLLVVLQVFLDKTSVALPTAVLFMTIIEALDFLSSALTFMLFFSFLMTKLDRVPEPEKLTLEKAKRGRIAKILMRSVVLLVLVVIGLANTGYMIGALNSTPLTISHRGVDNGNGVQNTIPVLELTAKEKPDYVEMDVQETKDHQFVVMHDANLSALAGVNKSPQHMTLSELTALTVRENGKSAKIASFSDYLSTAEKLHQKLLIEIKTSPQDPDDVATLTAHFLALYGSRILKNKDMMHSLDYGVVTAVKKDAPAIPISFILPFNLIFPETSADAYTMEETTLNSDFVSTAHGKGKKVYAWTINTSPLMQAEMLNGVDGIITDQLTELKAQIKEYEDHPSYATRLHMFITLVPSPGTRANN